MTNPTPEQVEAAAAALHAGFRAGQPWPEVPEYRQERWREHARAALVAAAGVTPQEPGEPTYSTGTRQWSGHCPCIRAEQVDPECEWHGRPEFRRGSALHPNTPSVAIVNEAKLAEAIAEELETEDAIAEDWSNGKLNATARRLVEFAVLPVLRGGVQ